jgi:hypothetical protein
MSVGIVRDPDTPPESRIALHERLRRLLNGPVCDRSRYRPLGTGRSPIGLRL